MTGDSEGLDLYPNPEAAAETEAISHEPTAIMVAKAPKGLAEDSEAAPLTAGYPYPGAHAPPRVRG